jgi:hypothetical protein
MTGVSSQDCEETAVWRDRELSDGPRRRKLEDLQYQLARVNLNRISYEAAQMPYPIALTELTRAPIRLSISQYIQITPSQFFSHRDKYLRPALRDSPARAFKPLLRLGLF